MGGISVAADKTRANLKVIVKDEETKQPIRCWVEIWSWYGQTELPKGEHTFKNLGLTSGTPGTKEFLEGWAIKIFSGPAGDPDAKIYKWPDVDTVLKPEGGKTHTKECFVKGPRAQLTVKVKRFDGSPMPDGVEVVVAGAPRGKTNAQGELVIPDAPQGATTVRLQMKGWAEVPKDPSNDKVSVADEASRPVTVGADGKTVVEFSVFKYDKPKGIRGTLPATQGVRATPHKRKDNELPTRASTDPKFENNPPVVLLRGSGIASLEVYGEGDLEKPNASTILGIKATRCQGMTWSLKRRDGMVVTSPALTAKDGGRRAELACDVGGAFNVVAKGNGVELAWNVVFVTVELQSSTAVGQSGNFVNDTSDKDTLRVGFKSGVFGFPGPLGTGAPGAAWHARAQVKLVGWDAAKGLDEVEVRILQNGIGDDLTAKYDEGHTGLEVPRGGLPIVDCNPARFSNGVYAQPGPPLGTYGSIGPWADIAPKPVWPNDKPHQNMVPPFIWTADSFRIDAQNTEVRNLETLDSPAGAFHEKHFQSKEKLRAIEGGIRFRVAIASFSRHAPNTILVHATIRWSLTFTGTVKQPLFGRASYAPNGAAVTSDAGFAPIDAGDTTLAQDAGKAGFETVEPRYNSCQISWTPGGIEG